MRRRREKKTNEDQTTLEKNRVASTPVSFHGNKPFGAMAVEKPQQERSWRGRRRVNGFLCEWTLKAFGRIRAACTSRNKRNASDEGSGSGEQKGMLGSEVKLIWILTKLKRLAKYWFLKNNVRHTVNWNQQSDENWSWSIIFSNWNTLKLINGETLQLNECHAFLKHINYGNNNLHFVFVNFIYLEL